MYESLIAVCICLAIALGAVFFLARQLVAANRRVLDWAGKCLEHTCAFNEDQRLFMQAIRAIDAQKPPPGPEAANEYRPSPVFDQTDTVTTPIPYPG